MIQKITTTVTGFFQKGHERTLTVKRNVVVSFLLKGLSIAANLLLIPLTINYVNPTQYGLWLTLSSIMVWFSFFDVGLGQGLKNKLIAAITAGDKDLAKSYVSTTYFAIGVISVVLMVLFLIVNPFLNWLSILNAPASLQAQIALVPVIVFGIFCLQFVLQLINTVAVANQNLIIPSFVNFLSTFVGLVIILILMKLTKGSLVILCLSIGVSPVLVLIAFSVVLFAGRYRDYAPSAKYVKLKYIKNILQLGIKFFIIQLGVLFFYNVDNILISHIINPGAVTSYNVAYKYFGVITMISNIVMTPFWGAFGEAHLKGEHQWIKDTVLRLQKIVGLVLLLGIGMLIASPLVYHYWVGDKIVIPFALSAILLIYTVVNTYRTIFVYYMNGISILNVQLVMVFCAGVLNIPFGYYLGHKFGSTGVIMATTILCVCCGIIEVWQYRLLINNRAKGIWAR